MERADHYVVDMAGHTKLFTKGHTFAAKVDKCTVGVHIVGGSEIYVAINDAARVVWAAANHRKAVRDKSRRAHDAGELYRMAPMAYDIYVPRAQLGAYLRLYAHRDARGDLENGILDRIDEAVGDSLKEYALSRIDGISSRMCELRLQLEQLKASQAEWAKRADEWAPENGAASAEPVPPVDTGPASPANAGPADV